MVRPGRDRFSGTVEEDETYIGGEKSGKRRRGAAGKALVLGAVEDQGNQIGRIRLRRVIDASACYLIGSLLRQNSLHNRMINKLKYRIVINILSEDAYGNIRPFWNHCCEFHILYRQEKKVNSSAKLL